MAEASSSIIDRTKTTHRKSRLGCKICKARKIKCDEVRPVCGNCYRRFPDAEDQCEYEPTQTRISSPSPGASMIESSASSIKSSTSTSRSMELRLFHHFSTVTCLTMPTCEEPYGLKMWKDIIPALAFDCSYIYSAILAIAALHLLTTLPPSHCIDLKAAAYQYIGETVSAHREEMSSTSSSHAINRFTASILIAMHAKLRTLYESNSDTPYTPPVNYFMLQNGAKELWHQDLDMDDDIKGFIACYSHLGPRSEPFTPPSQFREHVYLARDDFHYDPLPAFVESNNSISHDRKLIYMQALSYIGIIKQCLLNGERAAWIQHRLAIAPSVFGTDFCLLMQEIDPVSLLIVARLFALGKFVDEPWWLKGTAEYELKGLETIVPEEWGWGLEWPFEILGGAGAFMDEQEG